jgi:ketosteroid isomerase-like protein
MNKDTAALFNTFVPDSTLFIFSPDSASTLTGFQEIKYLADNVWMTDRFKAIECNIRNLRIEFSQSGDVAWYSCYLDDISEWDGQKSGWRNVRWTGVLEKKEGKWLIMQMHFSFPVERFK